MEIGRDEKLTRLFAEIMADNHAMQHVSRSVGFKLTAAADNRDDPAKGVPLIIGFTPRRKDAKAE